MEKWNRFPEPGKRFWNRNRSAPPGGTLRTIACDSDYVQLAIAQRFYDRGAKSSLLLLRK
jgi:hypothetical protein